MGRDKVRGKASRSGLWVQRTCDWQRTVPPHTFNLHEANVVETLLLFSIWLFREGHVPVLHIRVRGWMARKSDSFRLSGGGLGVLEVGLVRPEGPTRHRRDGDDGGGPCPRTIEIFGRMRLLPLRKSKFEVSRDGATSAHSNGMT